MANIYYKMLSSKMNASYKNDFITNLQQDLRTSIKNEEDDLFSMIMGSRKQASGLDINVLLKYYMLNQIIESTKATVDTRRYIQTKNPNIRRDREGKYYRVKDDVVKQDDSIISVNPDGSYAKVEKKNENSLKVVKVYDKDDSVKSIKIYDNSDKLISNKTHAAELLGLRREYKKKYKYSGFSGNSKDVVASFKNFLSTPIETGYYMDFHCKFYKWDKETSSFVRMMDRDNDSPLLVDIEFCDNGTVLRQEYLGLMAS